MPKRDRRCGPIRLNGYGPDSADLESRSEFENARLAKDIAEARLMVVLLVLGWCAGARAFGAS